MKPRPPRFSAFGCSVYAAASQLTPPVSPHIRRVVPVGALVAMFFLPLALCLPINRFAELSPWQRAKVKSDTLKAMLIQNGLRRADKPLPGRPMVLVVRFSNRSGDVVDTGFSKNPVDRLTGKVPLSRAKKGQKRRPMPAKRGLGFLVDDDPGHVDLHVWWEPAPPGKGFVWVRVFEGETV